jgi:hypothetical protein
MIWTLIKLYQCFFLVKTTYNIAGTIWEIYEVSDALYEQLVNLLIKGVKLLEPAKEVCFKFAKDQWLLI